MRERKMRSSPAGNIRLAFLIGAAAAFLAAAPAYASEWQKTSDGWILTENGERKTGWQQLDGTWYYLNPDGVMQTGWQQLDGKWYYLADDGAMQTRWIYLDNNWYYLRDSGEMLTGWADIDGYYYYLEDSGEMRREDLTTDEAVYRFNSDGSLDRVRMLKNQGGGAYRVDFFSEDQQEIADTLNDLRLESREDDEVDDSDEDDYDRGENALYNYDTMKSFEFDGVLQKTAEHRLEMAIQNGYSASSIPGEGKVEDYLKNIGSHMRSRKHLEIFLNTMSDGSGCADKIETRYGEDQEDAVKRASYYRYAGIAEKRVNGRYYVMIELFR